MTRTLLLATGILFAFGAGAASAADLVVVQARGLQVAPGATIDGSKSLSLEDGQQIVLLASSGQLVTIDGPFSGKPDSRVTPVGGGEANAVTALLTAREARTSEVGVVRGAAEVKLPSPWVVDVTHPGTSCIPVGKPVVLWREGDLAQTQVALSPADRSWTVSGQWPASAAELQMPPNLPLQDRTSYVIDIGGKVAPVTLRLIPESVTNDLMRASWMSQVGCDTQADTLLQTLKPQG